MKGPDANEIEVLADLQERKARFQKWELTVQKPRKVLISYEFMIQTKWMNLSY